MIDATRLKTHRTTSGIAVKKGSGRLLGRTKGSLRSCTSWPTRRGDRITCSSRHARPRTTGGQALLSSMPLAGLLQADWGDDADWFRNALIEMGISPCISSRLGRKVHIPLDATLYRLRH